MRKLLEAHGGACVICGYDRCDRALAFHHVDPSTKSFSISANRKVMGFPGLYEETKKCILVCSNCHAEIEAGIRTATGELVITPL